MQQKLSSDRTLSLNRMGEIDFWPLVVLVQTQKKMAVASRRERRALREFATTNTTFVVLSISKCILLRQELILPASHDGKVIIRIWHQFFGGSSPKSKIRGMRKSTFHFAIVFVVEE